MTRRRWMAERSSARSATLRGEQAHHLARVLRAQPGMLFDVVAGGELWRASVASVAEDSVSFDLLEPLAASQALPLTLLLSVFKFDRMEWAIEKGTELGVAAVVPVLARRTEKHLAQAAGKRAERWRRIALEAAKQSRRTELPEIADPVSLADALRTLASPAPATLRLLLAETETHTTLAGALGSADTILALTLAVGPEGGWAPDELALFATHGWQSVSLGPRILRAETAAIAAIAISGSALLQPSGSASIIPAQKEEPRS